MTAIKTAFIGLGVMGYPMAGHLVKAGYDVTVYNRTTSKAEAWVKEHGGVLQKTPSAAADGADVVCACVGNDDDLRGVAYGDDGILGGMKTGAVFVDHTIRQKPEGGTRDHGMLFRTQAKHVARLFNVEGEHTLT